MVWFIKVRIFYIHEPFVGKNGRMRGSVLVEVERAMPEMPMPDFGFWGRGRNWKRWDEKDRRTESWYYAVQRVSDTAKGLAQRIGGIAPVALADNEKTFPELFDRIQKTIEILETVKVRFKPKTLLLPAIRLWRAFGEERLSILGGRRYD
jgi:hypothetical protein